MKQKLLVKYHNVLLRSLHEDDLETLREFRNQTTSPFLQKLDYITTKAQKNWFEQNKVDEGCYIFTITETRELQRVVGSCALYNFTDTSAEFGRMLIGDGEAHGRGIGFLSTLLCLYAGFENFGLQQIVAKVHQDNVAAIKSYFKAGFSRTNKQHIYSGGGYELEIEVDRASFFKAHSFIDKIQLVLEV